MVIKWVSETRVLREGTRRAERLCTLEGDWCTSAVWAASVPVLAGSSVKMAWSGTQSESPASLVASKSWNRKGAGHCRPLVLWRIPMFLFLIAKTWIEVDWSIEPVHSGLPECRLAAIVSLTFDRINPAAFRWCNVRCVSPDKNV